MSDSIHSPSTHDINDYSQQEDAALKTAWQFFASDLLPFFQISGSVKGIAPTELISLELKKLFQDFNLILEDGSWKHFEFQSKNEGLAGLKRFRTYEALTSRFELYVKLQEGLDDVAAGRTRPWKDVKAELLNHWGRE